MRLEGLRDKKIAILGLGVNNRHLAEYFKVRSIPFETLDGWGSLNELIGRLDNFGIIFRTPGLPYLSEPIQQAKAKGVGIYSQTKLFFDLCPASIIGVTGTKGKGTTATLISKILEAAHKKVWLAGNIGQDPFEFLDKIGPSDLVVLELSSFQLQDLHKSPHIAVVLRIFPEHLDYHKNFAEYLQAKKPIVAYQNKDDFAVLNHDHEATRDFATSTPGKIIWNSVSREVSPGSFLRGEKIVCRWGDREFSVMDVSEIRLLGRFNLENVTASIAGAMACGVRDVALLKKVVSGFSGLPHRLEFVAEIKGVKFYNDSAATTPETTVAAISAFDSPIVLIVGGSEKHSDYSGLAGAITKSPIKSLLPIGLTGSKIAGLARQASFRGRILDKNFSHMKLIVEEARALAEPGDVVLLSPASASFDMFKNYQHRGELFKKFVKRS